MSNILGFTKQSRSDVLSKARSYHTTKEKISESNSGMYQELEVATRDFL